MSPPKGDSSGKASEKARARGEGARRAKGERLDERVVREGLAESRNAAQALIMAGRVLVSDQVADKAGARVAAEKPVRLKGGARSFVSRGGEKLVSALEAFDVDPQGLRCLDVGASTGGFTDCLLQRGAASVVALDVGHSQMHSRLRLDPRVDVRERVNARHLVPSDFAEPIDLFVVDVSFISLTLVLPALDACAPAAQGLLLVKPQFEVGREQVGKGGVVRDEGLRQGAADKVAAMADSQGRRELGRVDSGLAGPKGNREIFLWLSARRAEG